MISRTLSLYKNAYSGLSPSTWWLSFIMLVNRSGTMVLPFMTIYLTASKGYSIGMAGVVMALFGLGAVTGAFLGGKLTDRIGFYPVQLITLLGGGVLFMILGQMQAFPLICLFTYLLSLVNEAFRPANSTAIVAYSKDNTRTRSYALHRLAINLGWAVGSALGGVLAARSYTLLFWVDGATNIIAALLLVYLLRPSKQVKPAAKKETVKDPLHSAYRDKIYLWFILLTILFATCFFQLFTNLNAYYKIELHFSEQFIGLIGALNGVMIAVIEMVLVFKLENRRPSLFYIIRGTLLVGTAYFMLNIFHIEHVMALLMMVVMTMGEILVLPFMNTFWTARSAEHNRGEYAGLYTIAWSIAQTAGPFLASQLAERAGFTVLWWVLGAMSVVTAAGFVWLKRKLEV
jgi:predicted MFS family arabinose efflux permease